MTQEQKDLLSSTRNWIPVLLMVAGFLGFCACLAVAIISVRSDLLAMAGLCATVACGSYFVNELTRAKQAQPPEPPMAPPPVPAAPEET